MELPSRGLRKTLEPTANGKENQWKRRFLSHFQGAEAAPGVQDSQRVTLLASALEMPAYMDGGHEASLSHTITSRLPARHWLAEF